MFLFLPLYRWGKLCFGGALKPTWVDLELTLQFSQLQILCLFMISVLGRERIYMWKIEPLYSFTWKRQVREWISISPLGISLQSFNKENCVPCWASVRRYKVETVPAIVSWALTSAKQSCEHFMKNIAFGRMDPRICMADSPCCPPETITTLLMNYTPI